jgi:hypothetical protein
MLVIEGISGSVGVGVVGIGSVESVRPDGSRSVLGCIECISEWVFGIIARISVDCACEVQTWCWV